MPDIEFKSRLTFSKEETQAKRTSIEDGMEVFSPED
jgi:hypothetical protein